MHGVVERCDGVEVRRKCLEMEEKMVWDRWMRWV